MEEGEEADDCFVAAGFMAEIEADGLDPLPVVWAVRRVPAESED